MLLALAGCKESTADHTLHFVFLFSSFQSSAKLHNHPLSYSLNSYIFKSPRTKHYSKMKFMKLGSKPDTFQSNGTSIRYVLSELATDVTIIVDDVKFYLHKFPLLSKSSHLQKLILKAKEDNSDEIQLAGFPGGHKAFEICAKFCYGMVVTLNAYNVVAARCAAEFLEMAEYVEQGNLIFKIEVFLDSSIFRSWKDSVIALQTTKSLLPWAEDLKIVGRCVDSIASKTFVDPLKVTWSYTNNRKLAMCDKIVEHGSIESVPKDWWVEDICELDIELYKRVMIAVKSKGRMDGAVIGEALRTFAVRWLPDSVEALISDELIHRHKYMLETIICLLPSDKAVGCSCSFLLKLLKAASLVEVGDSMREDLVQKVSLKLDEASSRDLLIPAKSPQTTIYDVELVMHIVKRFAMQDKYSWNMDSVDNEKGSGNVVIGRGSWLSVGRLVDAYLVDVSHDPHLEVSSFIDLAQLIPELARPIHDGLYRAIDIYLKEHPDLSKTEKKKICGLMDVKRLTMEASMHAAQNERLPLRVVVQVLYFEQVRSTASGVHTNNSSLDMTNSTASIDEEWENNHQDHHPSSRASLQNCKSVRKQMDMVKLKDEEDDNEEGFQKSGRKISKKGSKNSRSGIQLLPSRSRRIFDKLWVMGKGLTESKNSETSGSSQSPTSLVPGENKSSGSSSRQRNRRHSIS